MSHIAIPKGEIDPCNRGTTVELERIVNVVDGEPTIITLDTARAAQRLAALGEMTGGIIHDFRNLLAVIGSAIRLAQTSSEQPETALIYMAGAQEGVDRGLKLTSQLLTFATHSELDEPEELGIPLCNANQLLKNLERLLAYGAGPGVRVTLVLASDIPKCLIDPSQFDAAILNLVVNARGAMADGGEIQISTKRYSEPATCGSPEPRKYVRVRVKDSGQGMPSEVLRKVFDPFFTTKGAEGTGLGLPQVHEFIRQMGGRISVASEQGTGTIVDLLFPQVDPGESAPPFLREAASSPSSGDECLKQRLVLQTKSIRNNSSRA